MLIWGNRNNLSAQGSVSLVQVVVLTTTAWSHLKQNIPAHSTRSSASPAPFCSMSQGRCGLCELCLALLWVTAETPLFTKRKWSVTKLTARGTGCVTMLSQQPSKGWNSIFYSTKLFLSLKNHPASGHHHPNLSPRQWFQALKGRAHVLVQHPSSSPFWQPLGRVRGC